MSDEATTRKVIEILVREAHVLSAKPARDRLLAIAEGEDQAVFNEVVVEQAAKRAADEEDRYVRGRKDRDLDAELLRRDGKPQEIQLLADCIGNQRLLQETPYWRGWIDRHIELTAAASAQA